MFVTKTANVLLSPLVVPALYRHVSGKEDARNLPQLLPFSTNPAKSKARSLHRESTGLYGGNSACGINHGVRPSAGTSTHLLLTPCSTACALLMLAAATLSLCTVPLVG